MQTLSIDIGYGHTKCMFNGELYKFPTSISSAGVSATSFATTESYDFEGGQYFVGDIKAVRDSLPTSDFSFLIKYAPLLLYKAVEIAKEFGLDDKKEIKLATGLSVLNWNDREKFKNRIREITVNKKNMKFNIKLFAQGQGVFYDYFGIDGDKDLNIVFDIGYLTNDFIVFDDNKPFTEKCFANAKGINRIITDLQNYVAANFENARLSESKINEILMSGIFRSFGKEIDLKKEINILKDKYIDEIILDLQANRKDIIRESNKIILSGGGAYLFQDNKIFPNIVLSKPQYEFANVRGYDLKSN